MVRAPAVSPSTRISDLRPTAVNAILAEVREHQARGQSLFSLMRGEPDLATPEHIVEACTRALKSGRTSYPDNHGELAFREAVAEKLHRDNGLHYHPGTEILATTGATFGIYAALASLLNKGDEVLLPDPIYDAYQSPVRLCGGRVRSVTSKIQGSRFVIAEEALEAAWSPAARVLIVNTPWNPVGTVLTRAEIEIIARFCERRNLVLLSDEIYEAITYGDAKHISPPAASHGLRERCVLINSLSKTYAMTGWRVGYCAGPAHLIQAMYMVLAQSSRGPATFIQDAAAEALISSQKCVAEMRAEYAKRREQVIAALAGIPGVSVLPPEGGFFVVVHGAAYGPAGEGTLRVSFASGGEKLASGLAALREGLFQIRDSQIREST